MHTLVIAWRDTRVYSVTLDIKGWHRKLSFSLEK